jgi:phage-related protein
MLEQLKYKNHVNEVFEFGKDGIFVNTNDLHDYEWTVTQKGNRIAAIDRSVSKRNLPIIILCDTEEKGIEARNKLLEVVEKDVLAMQHGRIILGDYYFRCFVTKSQKKNYLTTKRMMEVTLTLTTDFPYWVKEETFTFRKPSEGGSVGGQNLDFNFDYPFDFASSVSLNEVGNTGFVGSNFRMVIYGACINPAVRIAGHLYQVNCEVGEGKYLTIDSVSKKIYVTAVDGTTTNVFNLRNRDSYIFEKIAPGTNHVTWEGNFGFDITLLEERSEPKWT